MDNKFKRIKTKNEASTFFADTPCQLSVNNSQFVLRTLKDLYEEKQLCDVYLIVGDKEYGAHKLILSAASDVFQVMLMNSGWSECHQNRINLGEVPQCQRVFPMFLQYFYTGELLITHTNVQPILSLADKYMVKSLSKLCLQYMYDHISHASSHNQLFSWLQYFQSCGHKEMAKVCEDYIKLNFETVSNSADFVNLDPENLVQILKQDDLVIINEATLYNCVVKWLDLQRRKLEEEKVNAEDGNRGVREDEEIPEYVKYLTVLVMQHVRFPMMRPREIAELLRSPLVKENIEFFMERMSMSVELHSNNEEIMNDVWMEENQHLIQPRLYTQEKFSSFLKVEDFTSIQKYQKVSCRFRTDSSVFESVRHLDKNEWMGILFPKGVLFDPCYLIHWQGRYEVPEKILPTVRLNMRCLHLCKPGKFKFSVLVFGVRGKVEHIMGVKSEIHDINDKNVNINIDDIIPFHSLNPAEEEANCEVDNSYFTGVNGNELKLQIIVMPLS